MTNIDALADKIATAAMRVVARHPEIRSADSDMLESVVQAMRDQAQTAISKMLDDAQAAPWISQAAFATAVLDIAQAGISALRK